MSNVVSKSCPWVRYRAACYLRGKGFSFGTGHDPIYPPAAIDSGKYSLNFDVLKDPKVHAIDSDFSIIAGGSCDHVFIGPRLDESPDPKVLLQQAVGKLHEGGHLVLFTSSPKDLAELGYWQLKDVQNRAGMWLQIAKLLGKQKRGIAPGKPQAARRACIVRYGAIGDMVMLTPLIRKLAEDGYEVTLNITPYCAEVIKHNPYVSNVLLQERDIVPNSELGGYWEEWVGEYDKYINLSESIEGRMLKVEGRRDFFTTREWRAESAPENYYDLTMSLGGYPEATGQRGEIYFSRSEQREAQHIRDIYKGRMLVLWALKGSSYHKQYPTLRAELTQWLASHPLAQVVLMGSRGDQALQWEAPQVVPAAGELDLRLSLALCAKADLVVGPESALTNAAGCFATPKIVMLSHSSADNLTKYFENCTSIVPNVGCYPCHQLHYSKPSCPLVQIGAAEHPACTQSNPALWQALDAAYNSWQAKVMV